MTKTQRPQTQDHRPEQPRLELRRETLRDLSAADLGRAVGGPGSTSGGTSIAPQ
jgi:hypothetical protein